MAVSRKASVPRVNRLLGLLSLKDYKRLHPHLRRIPLEYRQSLYRANKRVGMVYFIETGVGSLVNTMANGQAAEVGTIGNEGLVGLPLVFGDDRAPTSVYVQVPGSWPENECDAVRKGNGAKRLDAIRDASLCSRLLQSGRAVRRLQSVSSLRAAMLPLAADDARPHGLG